MTSRPLVHAQPFPVRGQHRSLVLELTKRDVFGRYRGASLGVVWAVLTPFLMLAVYAVAFGEILRARWPGATGQTDFALIIFVGLITHGFFAECLSRAPSLVVGNVSYVKRIVFPLEILPWPLILSGLFHMAMNFLVLFVALLVIRGAVPWTFVLVPLVIAPLVLVALGTAWLFAALGVYFRDISQLVAPLSTALLFLSSAIVPVASLPEKFQVVFRLNPLTLIIDQARLAALDGSPPDMAALSIYALGAFAWCIAGYAAFRRMRGGFADVL